ncbi:GntR family transcriptional regulator [Pseudonocardia spinosispora]|uniref:GntR family transcriptional regulator n=1 Tax=Pseudonocardia spinosispora TaxID=103441 RepID=UPI0003FA772D|nr:GntR family transcriptional regulator [Pseudonocardia spinosispora]
MRTHRTRSALITVLTAARPGQSQAEILDELRRCVLDGDVPPGTPIPVDAVAEVFGVSRIPIRESLKTLIGEGLVEHRQNLGYTVARLSLGELRELYLVREVLEVAALTAAVAAADASHDEEARAAHHVLREATLAGDSRAYHRETKRFHWALVQPCGMHRLLGMLESAWNVTEPLQLMTHVGARERHDLHHDHDKQLAAFLARDTTSLLASCREHYQRLRVVLEGLPQHTGLLTDPD